MHLNSVSNSVHLLKRSVRVALRSSYQKSVFKLQAIFDCVATDSFVRYSSLPSCVKDQLFKFNNINDQINSSYEFKKQSFEITSATGTVTECCVVFSFIVTFGSWVGFHEFIVTDNLHGKDMLIGRDFLKRYNVKFDNGRDIITLDKPKDIRANVESNYKIKQIQQN